MPPSRLLIVYHSQTGNTARLAQAAWCGALDSGDAEVRFRMAADSGLHDLLWCQGIVLATPENFGNLSGGLKDFLDRTYYPAQGEVEGRPYALLISCDNDGEGAAFNTARIAKGYPFKPVAEPLICRGAITEAHLQGAHELGASLAAGLAMGIF
ncbi:MAG: NAD(P)H-dependent oxidoreductase [Pseudomonadota bacterium]|nr:NAD(P)H-dependent oxidoreductase [Pseudomonadota bacterium]